VFLVLVASAPAPVWKVRRSAGGTLVSLERQTELINHISFHIIDAEWGHVTVKMAAHPLFGAQVILNGHAYVAAAVARLRVGFREGGKLFHVGHRHGGHSRDRRYLVFGRDYRATGQGLPAVDLQFLPVLRWTPPSSKPAGLATPTRSTRPNTPAT
jgi:hypothetical protein